jgi:hypothetical protein
MKFYAKVLVDVEIEADSEDYAEKLLSEDNHKLHLDVQGCSVDHGCFSLKCKEKIKIETNKFLKRL